MEAWMTVEQFRAIEAAQPCRLCGDMPPGKVLACQACGRRDGWPEGRTAGVQYTDALLEKLARVEALAARYKANVVWQPAGFAIEAAINGTEYTHD